MSKVSKILTRNLNYISLFSGAGVGCYGFKKAGFDCVLTNEFLKKRLDIQKYNSKCKYDSGYILGDIRDKKVKEKLFLQIEKFKKTEKVDDIDVVIATPPCQGMSVANQKKNNELSRNSLILEAISIIKAINPKIFIFENVKSFLTTFCWDNSSQFQTIGSTINQSLGGVFIFFKNY